MKPFQTLNATAVPIRSENVDTDRIIPARFLTTVTKQGLGTGLFADWRRNEEGNLRADFPLNMEKYRGAEILLAGANFGCGSSREHAPWAIIDAGFKVVIAPSFADIFYNNSLKNGLLLVPLAADYVEALMKKTENNPGLFYRVDLEEQTVSVDGADYHFDIDPFRKRCLISGLDDLGYLLSKSDAIAEYECGLRHKS